MKSAEENFFRTFWRKMDFAWESCISILCKDQVSGENNRKCYLFWGNTHIRQIMQGVFAIPNLWISLWKV